MSLPFKSHEFDHYGGYGPSFRTKDKKQRPMFGSLRGMRRTACAIIAPLVILAFIISSTLRGAVLRRGMAVSSLSPFSGVSAALMRDDPHVETVFHYDLAHSRGSGQGWIQQERVLFLVPLRDAAPHLDMFFGHMVNLTYPHNLIDLAFLVSDSKDNTLGLLREHLMAVQTDPNPKMRFGTIDIYEKDFGQAIGQGFSDRHGFEAQGPRRKLMARARNWLLSVALKPYHSWVYWRDADVQTVPPTVLEDLMGHNKDVIVPNVWRPLPDWLGNEQPYDLNSWQESETSLQLADQLDEDAVIVEGYVEYATWRPHLAYLRDPYGDPTVEMELDGIGGVSILAKASVFRSGAHFPAFSFQKHAETEGFGKMCRRMGYSVVGLPHYTIWHIYEPSSDDLKHMEWMAQEEERQQKEEKLRIVRDKVWAAGYMDVHKEWTIEKVDMLKNTEFDDDLLLMFENDDLSELEIDIESWTPPPPPEEILAKPIPKPARHGPLKKGGTEGAAGAAGAGAGAVAGAAAGAAVGAAGAGAVGAGAPPAAAPVAGAGAAGAAGAVAPPAVPAAGAAPVVPAVGAGAGAAGAGAAGAGAGAGAAPVGGAGAAPGAGAGAGAAGALVDDSISKPGSGLNDFLDSTEVPGVKTPVDLVGAVAADLAAADAADAAGAAGAAAGAGGAAGAGAAGVDRDGLSAAAKEAAIKAAMLAAVAADTEAPVDHEGHL